MYGIGYWYGIEAYLKKKNALQSLNIVAVVAKHSIINTFSIICLTLEVEASY